MLSFRLDIHWSSHTSNSPSTSWIFLLISTPSSSGSTRLSTISGNILLSFTSFFVRELGKIEARDFGKFEYLSLVREEDRPQFVTIMKHLILNLQVRFYQPSFSLDKRSIKKYLDYDNVSISPEAPNQDRSRCGLSQLFELFNIRQTRSDSQTLGCVVGLQLVEEVDRLIPVLYSERDLILRKHVKELKGVVLLRRE